MIGIDLGTSGVKAVILQDAETVLADAAQPIAVSIPHVGWSEQDADDWVAAVWSCLDRLAATIAARKGADPEESWTAKLLSKGPEKCAEKFGEEAVEAIIEAVKGDGEKLTAEAADVLYHLLVMLAARDVSLDQVLAELERREGTSGIAEKAARG